MNPPPPPPESTPGAVAWIRVSDYAAVHEFLGPTTADALADAAEVVLRRAAEGIATDVHRVDEDGWLVEFTERLRPSEASNHLALLIDELSAPLEVRGLQLFAAPRAGLAIPPVDGTRAEVLRRRARAAVRHAERTGATTVRWHRELTDAQRRRTRLLSDFHRALGNDELHFCYQPKRRIADQTVQGAEALVRWHHPALGVVTPDEFIGLVESTALIRPFTRWALSTACTDWARARERLPGSRVAVNLPIPVLTDVGLAELVVDTVLDEGLDPAMLQVEITERNVAGREEDLIAGLGLLTELGISVSLDDFGTGQSSLAYLRHLPLDEVKIDRIFVAGIDDDPVNQSVVAGCVGIARALGITTCVEGVETEDELRTVGELGADLAQGYLLGRPAPIDVLLGLT